MRVALYARVSSQHQVSVQTSKQQLERLRKEVEMRGLSLAAEHVFRDDGYSGARLNRPGLDSLRDAVAFGAVDLVLITAPDRLARKYVHQVLLIEEFEKSGCLVEFAERPMSQDPHDQLLLQIRGAVAEYERSLISERMRRGRLAKLRAGVLLPYTRLPYGYRSDPARPRDPAGVRIEESEAAVVRLMFDHYTGDGATLYKLIQKLLAAGIPSVTGRPLWNPSSIRHILTNPIYTGTAYGNRYACSPARQRYTPMKPVGRTNSSARLRPPEEWISIPVPAIIEQDIFELVQAKLEHNRKLARRNNTQNQYLLRCLVTCGRCQLACAARKMAGSAYYVCSRKMDTLTALRHGGRCDARYVPARALEEAVWDDLCAVLRQPELIELALARAHGGHWLPQELQTRQASLRGALKQLDHQQERLLEAYLASVVELSEFERTRSELLRRREQLLVQQKQLEASAAQRKELANLAASIEEFCTSVRDSLMSASFEQKRQLVELLIDRVIVEDERVEIRYVMPTARDGPKIPFCRLRLNYLDKSSSIGFKSGE